MTRTVWCCTAEPRASKLEGVLLRLRCTESVLLPATLLNFADDHEREEGERWRKRVTGPWFLGSRRRTEKGYDFEGNMVFSLFPSLCMISTYTMV
jgi:hypothetical protein